MTKVVNKEINSTLQNIPTIISNSEQPVDRNKIAQQLILKEIYKANQQQLEQIAIGNVYSEFREMLQIKRLFERDGRNLVTNTSIDLICVYLDSKKLLS